MKQPGYQERAYRGAFKGADLVYFGVCVMETDLLIGAKSDLTKEAGAVVRKYRRQLEEYIARQPKFLTSLEPVEPLPGAPDIAVRMCTAAKAAGVGPMAAVAGAFSQIVGEELLAWTDEVIVENGGDIYIKSNIGRIAGIYAGESSLSGRLGVMVPSAVSPLGICTSSGTVGHSLSFGKADAAVILAKDAYLADAVATAVCNRVKTPEDISAAIEFGSTIEGVIGIVIIIGDKLGAWGKAELIKLT